jgi:hypothetical protein
MPERFRQLPIALDIPAPCAADWDFMVGGAKVRHCAHCNKDVHTLSELSEARIVALLERGDVCVRLRVAPDGAVVHRARNRSLRAARVVATAALAALAACSEHEPASEHAIMETQMPVTAADAGVPPPANALTAAPASAPSVPVESAASVVAPASSSEAPRPIKGPRHTMGVPRVFSPR